MNQDALREICKRLSLGVPLSKPNKVYGGLLHLMWRINTMQGSYAIKQISQGLMTQKEKDHYETTENIASYFAQHGIPAVSALGAENKRLIEITGTTYLVYPWVEAKSLDRDEISPFHALKIADLLAKMHRLNFDLPSLEEGEFDVHPPEEILALIARAASCNFPLAQTLQAHQEVILAVNETYQQAIPCLKRKLLISHGDLDQKNVLWDKEGSPLLIDWESARKLNPTYEIINTALDWSGVMTNLNKSLFVDMIKAYRNAGGTIDKEHLEPAFYGALGNALNWMVYNIGRACKATSPESEEWKIGVEMVGIVFPMILRVKAEIPELIELIS